MFPYNFASAVTARWIASFVLCVGLAGLLAREGRTAGTDVEEPQERLVMLTSGRILSGQVSRNAGGYLVEQPNGRVQVGVDEVRFIVDDLREGYRKQRDSIVHPSPATHISLATWCIAHRLYDEAQDELKKCLKADPSNEQARRLLQRLTDTIRANLPPSAAPPAPRKTSEGFIQPDVESLGGLSRNTATVFTSRIQPLLLNKCGNASCHGVSAPNEFRLVNARLSGNGSRQTSEKNLAEVLKYIDFEDIARSPLLAEVRSNHGGRGTIFVGPAGSSQYKTLKSWVITLAQEKLDEAEQFQLRSTIAGNSRSKATKRRVSQAAFAMDDDESESLDGLAAEPESMTDDSHAPKELDLSSSSSTATPLKPFDAFDPELFNRSVRRH